MIKEQRSKYVLLLAVLVVGLVGCGGAGQGSQSDEAQATGPQPSPASSKPSGPAEEPSGPAEVSTGTPIAITILVNELGYTLYSDGNDARGSGESACYGACERQWSPYLTAGTPVAWQDKPEVKKKLLGTIRRSDGTEQVTYAGYPLYLLKNEASAKASGLGKDSFGATWFAVQPDGTRIDHP